MLKQFIILAISVVSIMLLSACTSEAEDSKADMNRQSDAYIKKEELADDNPSEENGTIDSEPDFNSGNHEESADKGEISKDVYLKKLNVMEEADRYAETKDTTAELIEQETERYEKWDQELNIIYGHLKEQLNPEEMNSLREEQRKWIVQRDVKAKESSLKYAGGSMEPLEYVATQASVTRERCYELVAKYMN